MSASLQLLIASKIASGGTPFSIADANLKAVWQFENNLNDSTSNANNLTANTVVSFGTATPAPKQGTYWGGLASTNDANNSASALKPTGDFSAGGWFYSDAFAVNQNYALIGNLSGGGVVNFALQSQYSTPNYMVVSLFDASSLNHDYSLGVNIPATTWTHFAVVFDSVAQKLYAYVNGVAVTTGSFTGGFVSHTTGLNSASGIKSFSVGCATENFAGKVDTVFFFNKAISAGDVVTIRDYGFA